MAAGRPVPDRTCGRSRPVPLARPVGRLVEVEGRCAPRDVAAGRRLGDSRTTPGRRVGETRPRATQEAGRRTPAGGGYCSSGGRRGGGRGRPGRTGRRRRRDFSVLCRSAGDRQGACRWGGVVPKRHHAIVLGDRGRRGGGARPGCLVRPGGRSAGHPEPSARVREGGSCHRGDDAPTLPQHTPGPAPATGIPHAPRASRPHVPAGTGVAVLCQEGAPARLPWLRHRSTHSFLPRSTCFPSGHSVRATETRPRTM